MLMIRQINKMFSLYISELFFSSHNNKSLKQTANARYYEKDSLNNKKNQQGQR